jgi:hypothetical protein
VPLPFALPRHGQGRVAHRDQVPHERFGRRLAP